MNDFWKGFCTAVLIVLVIVVGLVLNYCGWQTGRERGKDEGARRERRRALEAIHSCHRFDTGCGDDFVMEWNRAIHHVSKKVDEYEP